MDNRIKINAKFGTSSLQNQGNLGKYFRRILSPMLSSEDPATSSDIPSNWYVKNETLHDDMDKLLSLRQNQRVLIVGHTGIGKTTFLRNYFGRSPNPSIISNRLIIPYYFDGMDIREDEDPKDKLRAKIMAACELIENQYNLKFEKPEFIEFIKNNRPDLLYTDQLEYGISITDRYNNFAQNYPYAYCAELIKYFMLKSPIINVTVVVDDIDTIRFQEHILAFAASASRFTYCLQNNDGDLKSKKSSYTTNLIFSCRPETEQLINKERNSGRAVLKGFPFEKNFEISKPVSLSKLFQTRFDAAMSDGKIVKSIQNIEKFNEYKEILDEIVLSVSDIDPDFLVGINNYNVRESLSMMQSVISNGRYIQPKGEVTSHFNINIDDFKITNASVIRAIGLKENKIYNSSYSPIKNILVNNRSVSSDLVGIYMIHLLCAGKECAPENAHEVNVDKSLFWSDMRRLFDQEELEKIIAQRLNEFLNWGILGIEKEDNFEETTEVIYLRPRGAVLWNDLSKRSLIFEFFRDDIYLPKDSADNDVWPLIIEPLEQLNSEDRMGSMLRLCDSYISKEYELLKRKENQGDLNWLREKVSEVSVNERLFDGVSNSIDRLFAGAYNVPVAVKSARTLVKTRLENLKKMLD